MSERAIWTYVPNTSWIRSQALPGAKSRPAETKIPLLLRKPVGPLLALTLLRIPVGRVLVLASRPHRGLLFGYFAFFGFWRLDCLRGRRFLRDDRSGLLFLQCRHLRCVAPAGERLQSGSGRGLVGSKAGFLKSLRLHDQIQQKKKSRRKTQRYSQGVQDWQRVVDFGFLSCNR